MSSPKYPRRSAGAAVLSVLVIAVLALASAARAQQRPYLGYAYPAGGQQGTTFQVRLGGQVLDDVNKVIVTGGGVSGKVLAYYRPLNPQEMALLSEQMRDLKRSATGSAANMMGPMMAAENTMTAAAAGQKGGPRKGGLVSKGEAAKKAALQNLDVALSATTDAATREIMLRIQKRITEYVFRPESVAIAGIATIEVTIARNAAPGVRELRLATPRGVSNPLVFHVGQLPEACRKPMLTSQFEVLGKEELALRKRPPEEVEDRIEAPCTVNGQVASGEVNRYRFQARKGQRLVLSTQARQLVPYIADAVPGWFQPVLAVYDARGREVAYDDDYRFKPDPVILFEVPHDGEYVFAIYDAIYRGREDFVYRVTIGELPFVTSIFPLGMNLARLDDPAAAAAAVKVSGWNLQGAQLRLPSAEAGPGIHTLVAVRDGMLSNPVPVSLDTLPEVVEKEPNNTPAQAQAVSLPVIINGRINRPDDWDVFKFTGHAGQTIVAEVCARRLDSPLDSLLKLTDAQGKLLAFNDDCEEIEDGINPHHADSYLTATLPADGTYFIHLGDTDRAGGDEYAYRLRISGPRPDFALRVVPSSVGFRSKAAAALTVYAIRRDGFNGPIKLDLKNPPQGFAAFPTVLYAGQQAARLPLKTDRTATPEPVNLTVMGRAQIGAREVVHVAVPAEDRMQAFLWRHLVPAQDLKALAFDPTYVPPSKRVPKVVASPPQTVKPASIVDPVTGKPKFTKQQVAGRLRQLKLLFEEGLLTDEFYGVKVAECEAAL